MGGKVGRQNLISLVDISDHQASPGNVYHSGSFVWDNDLRFNGIPVCLGGLHKPLICWQYMTIKHMDA